VRSTTLTVCEFGKAAPSTLTVKRMSASDINTGMARRNTLAAAAQ